MEWLGREGDSASGGRVWRQEPFVGGRGEAGDSVQWHFHSTGGGWVHRAWGALRAAISRSGEGRRVHGAWGTLRAGI